MERKHLSTVARQFKRSFSQQVLNGLGKAVRFCVRVREITPYRLALGLIEVFATMQVKTIADVHRAFNALCNTTVHYKPFHNQLVKATFPTFMRGLCEQLMAQLTSEVLRFAPQSAFAQFTHITIHDGTSFAVKSTLKKTFPGRFTKVSPAAVELHVSMELLSEGLETVTLTADKESEVHHAPAQNTLRGGLFLADRMFFIKRYLAEISAHGGYFIVKAKGVINPMIRQAHTHEGGAIKRFQNLPLKPVKSKVSKYRALDLDVAWEGELEARLIVTWDPKNKRPRYLVTNLPRAQFTLEQICDAYRLRWQVELMFKEWKSYASLHAFDTSKANIAEGLIWAALCAAILKRYCAHLAQRLWQVPISTRKVAMCLHHVLSDIFHALLHAQRHLQKTLQRALHYLSLNAQRAHPKRDQLSGRLKLSLQHVYAGP
jgi:Transposase DDE domain